MYEAMTPRMAGVFLALLEFILIPIPWAFYRRGQRIRIRSPVIKQMLDEQAKNDKKRGRHESKKQRQGASAAAPEAVVADGAEVGREVTPKNARGQIMAVAMEADVEKGT